MLVKDVLLMFWHPVEHYGPKLPELVVSLVIGFIAIKIILLVATHALRVTRMPKSLTTLLSGIIGVVLWILLFTEIAREAGMTSLAITISGSAVVVGLVLANAFAPVIADIASGLYLAKDPDFEVGYRVKIGEVEGTIRKVDIRKVRIRDDKGKLHIYPNSVVDKAAWTVVDRDPETKIDDKTGKK